MRWGAGRLLDFSQAPIIMGIINATPDSFFPASRALAVAEGLAAARRMIEEGAEILDIGGESTQPGSEGVGADEELERVVPLIEAVRRESNLLISVDTRKAVVAAAALDAGADLINDISALADDPAMGALVAERGVPVVLMHKRGEPATMQKDPFYVDAVGEITSELLASVERAAACGVHRDRIIIDPGIGFGKRLCDNLDILRAIPQLAAHGFPLLIGLSRKSFIGAILGGKPVEERLTGTLVANTYAAIAGADILRVHDVAESVQLKRVLAALRGQG